MAKDLPWKLKESRVLEILQAVCFRIYFSLEGPSLKLPMNVTYICMQIDSNTDGLVDFSEFVAATVHVNQLEEHNSEKWQQRSKAAFEKFDVDKDGFITPEEIKLVS